VPVGARATLAAPAALVHMRLHGPAGARVFIDNHEVGVLPLELELPRFAGMRHVSVVNGARRWSQEVAGDLENFVMVDLGPERPVRRPVRRPARPAVLLKDPFAQ